jgi:hypothetical protein
VIQNGVDQIRQERMVKRTAPAAAVARPGHARRPSDDF